jgi:phosphatidylglycerophosphate synthase
MASELPLPVVVVPPRTRAPVGNLAVFAFALGYFACYVPYSAITKALTSGAVGDRISGVALLPLSVLASAVAMAVTFTALGWWRHAGRRSLFGADIPWPGAWTSLSGLATAAIVVSTTMAYTFEGVSIPFVMLLMRGGVLLIAPLIDALTRRKVRWFSWVALALSLLGLVETVWRRGVGGIPLACAVDVGIYLAGYFVRLQLMARLGKSENRATMLRFFVEEQMVATPAAVAILAVAAALGLGPLAELRSGFLDLPWSPAAPWVLLVGALSQGTGFFGALVLLDARESSFSVPLNRASSVLAGVAAAFALTAITGALPPSRLELVGAFLLVVAIAVLSLGPRLDALQTSLRELTRLPNLLTLARLPLALGFLLVADRAVPALLVLAVAGLTDVLDGWVARRTGQSSKLGAALDGAVDKIFALTVTLALVLSGGLGLLDMMLLGVRDLGELALLGWLSLTGGLHPERERKALPLGKLTTLLQFATVTAAILARPERTAIAILAAIAGVGAAVEYWRRDLARHRTPMPLA